MIRFCPDLTLGTHIATIVPEESSSDEEDDLDLEDDSSDEVEKGTNDDESVGYESVDNEDVSEGEWSDFGYGLDDDDEGELHDEIDNEDNPNIGPEDGEEPLNHDLDILNTEGYGVL